MSHESDTKGISRRKALSMGAGATIGTIALTHNGSAGVLPAKSSPVVATLEGRLRGVDAGRLRIFKGIRYGEDTTGSNRFRPPVPISPWEGVRDATVLGDQCFQGGKNGSENCLVLNVWGHRDNRKRPVMVFLHGGGYRSGSGGIQLYDGTNLAERGDVVVVTLNHRLHILGFMHLADLSNGYKASSNVGLLDIVEALRWIRRNIQLFGGDPENVTIFGESGGGGKVSSLMAMPSASGLFHRAIIQSGSQRRYCSRSQATADAEAALRFLGIARSDLHALETIPIERLYAAYLEVTRQGGWSRAGSCLSTMPFVPVIDPETAPWHPDDPQALDLSKDIALMVGANEEEIAIRLGPIGPAGMLSPPADDQELLANIERMCPKLSSADKARLPSLLAAYRVRMPQENSWRIQLAMMSDLWMTRDAIAQAEARIAANCAPTYLYRFGWKDPCFGDTYAPHMGELLFVFDKLDLKGAWGELDEPAARAVKDPSGQRYRLRDAMVEAWSEFARSGKPRSNKIPEWIAYSTHTHATLRFDGTSTLVQDPLGSQIRSLLAQLDVGVGS